MPLFSVLPVEPVFLQYEKLKPKVFPVSSIYLGEGDLGLEITGAVLETSGG